MKFDEEDSVLATRSAKVGDSFAVGWADWQAELVQLLPKAELLIEIEPGPPLSIDQRGIPGFRAHLQSADGQRGA